jgi:hypothetical protein
LQIKFYLENITLACIRLEHGNEAASSKQQAASSKQQAASSKQQAASSKQQAASSKQQAASIEVFRIKPILIYVGYDWGRGHEEKGGRGGKGLNAHWTFLQKSVETGTVALEKLSWKRSKARYPLRVSVRRLRSRQGGTVLGSILSRIEEADVLVFDISGNNPNVLFELGYAMARKGTESGRIYIFSESEESVSASEGLISDWSRIPSDLRGTMLTVYQKNTVGKSSQTVLKIRDAKGFQSALLATLKEIAADRGMFGESLRAFESET